MDSAVKFITDHSAVVWAGAGVIVGAIATAFMAGRRFQGHLDRVEDHEARLQALEKKK